MAFVVKPTKTEPQIVWEDTHFVVVEKPHGMPTAPLKEDDTDNLVYFITEKYPKAKNVKGKKSVEYGLLHRLDSETHGLVVMALDQSSYDFLQNEQLNNRFHKYYTAFCNITDVAVRQTDTEFLIQSYFRPYGIKGRKVAPVSVEEFNQKTHIAKKCSSVLYTTRVIKIEKEQENYYKVLCCLTRGFRHQIRSHLSWMKYPLIADKLYNEDCIEENIPLQLHACAVSFIHPVTGKKVFVSLRDFFTSETR